MTSDTSKFAASFSRFAVAAAILIAAPAAALAQQAVTATPVSEPALMLASNTAADAGFSSSAASALPEAPTPTTSDSNPLVASVLGAPSTAHSNIAPLHTKYIGADQTAQKISAHDKVIIGAKDLYSFENLLAIPLSAGYSHVTNGRPNYGTNSKAFGQRVGAAAIRETTQGVFTDMILSPVLHTDPRYFQRGDAHNFFDRTFYAVTRVLVTRTDSGRSTVNAALLGGYAGTSAMTPLYYPQINHNFKDVASDYGGSLGGAALGFFISEFSDDVLEAFHLKHRQ